MPRTLSWSPDKDTTLRRMRHERRSWDAIARELGVSRWTAIERGHRINAMPGETVEAEIIIARTDRATLPPGHPISWGAIIAGTCLAGMAYPPPVS